MKKSILLIPFWIINLSVALSQSKLNINYACSYYGEKNPTSVYTFTSDNEAQSALKMITDASGLSTNFRLVAANVPNAAAVIFNNQRYILYNQTFMYNIGQRINYWASISILAHEVGHHLNGHSLTPGGSRPSLELEADKFSGFILSKLGATLSEAQSAINTLISESGSVTHPGRSARLAAIANGWYSNKPSTVNKEVRLIDKPKQIGHYDIDYNNVGYNGLKYIRNSDNVLDIDIYFEEYKFEKSDYKLYLIQNNILVYMIEFQKYFYIEDFKTDPLNTIIKVSSLYDRVENPYTVIKTLQEQFLIFYKGSNVTSLIANQYRAGNNWYINLSNGSKLRIEWSHFESLNYNTPGLVWFGNMY